MQTNQIKIQFSSTNIERDFYIYKFSVSTDWVDYSRTPVDALKHELNASSVVYLQGKTFYALFRKDNLQSTEFKKQLLGFKKKYDVIIEVIENVNHEPSINQRHLAQLLFNSLSSSIIDSSFNNINGSLYYITESIKGKSEDNKNIIWQYKTIQIHLTDNLELCLDVKTFSNVMLSKKMEFKGKFKLPNYPKYEIHDKTRTMKRVFDNEKNKENRFLLKQIRGAKKSIIPFLVFDNWANFKLSKCGILFNFMEDVTLYLSDYIQFEFINDTENTLYLQSDKVLTNSIDNRKRDFYINSNIVISDFVENEVSNSLLNELSAILSKNGYNIPPNQIKIGKIDKNALNIKIIKPANEYGLNEKDPYSNYSNHIVQHVTVGDFFDNNKKKLQTTSSGTNPAVDNILKELFIKSDIVNKQVQIIDWNYGNLIFMTSDREIREKDNSKNNIFNVIKIDNKGRLEFYRNDTFQDPIIDDLANRFNTALNYNTGTIYGLVSDGVNINTIIDTTLFTIPNIKGIGTQLRKEQKNTRWKTDEIISLVQLFIGEHQKEQNINLFQDLTQAITEWGNTIDKLTLIELLERVGLKSNQKKIKVLFIDFFELKTGDVLVCLLKNKRAKQLYLEDKININYREVEPNKKAMYFVGELDSAKHPLQSTFHNATKIRYVEAIQGNLIFDTLLNMMNVDFVKNGELTVIPFPFKYLRECKDILVNADIPF